MLCLIGELMFVHRTRCEITYLECFREIRQECLDARRSAGLVDPTTWIWNRSELCVEFRYLRKNSSYWNVFCRNERRLRSKHGRAIPYQCLATFGLGLEFFRRGLARLTDLTLTRGTAWLLCESAALVHVQEA